MRTRARYSGPRRSWRGAVECRAQHVGLLLDAFEHAVHGAAELVELVVDFSTGSVATGRPP
jgi:hypothetical protein